MCRFQVAERKGKNLRLKLKIHVCQISCSQGDYKYKRALIFTQQVQENSPGQVAGLEPFFDFIVAIGNTRLVCYFLKFT